MATPDKYKIFSEEEKIRKENMVESISEYIWRNKIKEYGKQYRKSTSDKDKQKRKNIGKNTLKINQTMIWGK